MRTPGDTQERQKEKDFREMFVFGFIVHPGWLAWLRNGEVAGAVSGGAPPPSAPPPGGVAEGGGTLPPPELLQYCRRQ